jgi:hypothetical protein
MKPRPTSALDWNKPFETFTPFGVGGQYNCSDRVIAQASAR